MADDIIPGIQAGGQAGAGRASAGGTDYRSLQGPESIRTDLPDNGAAARAAALGSVFKEFEGISGDIYTQAATKAGALAGAASGATGKPEYKQGLLRFSAYSRAFNNAATGAYAVQAEAQADDAAARLRVQANNDPNTFRTTYSAVRDGVLKNAPPDAVPMLTELYNKHLAAGIAAISGDQATQIQQTQRATYDEGVARQTSRVANLQGSANPQDQLRAEDEHAKLSALIDGGVNAGLYSTAEAKAMHIGAMRTITAQVFQTQVDRELARPDGDVVTLLDNFRNAHEANLANTNEAPVLSEPEFQKLMADATTKIREQNLLVAMNKREGKTAEQLRYEAGDQQYTSMLFQGKLTDSALDGAVRAGDLKPETARSLHNMLLQGDQTPKSNPEALARLYNDPNFPDMTFADISKQVGPHGLSWTDAGKAAELAEKKRDTWEGTQASKQAKGEISAALKIPPGTMMAALSDEQRKSLVNATQEWIGLQNATEPAKRDQQASANAQIAIQHAQRQQAAADVQMLTKARSGYMTAHGPGSAEPVDDKVLQGRLKQYDDQIAQRRAAAKGE